MSERWREPVLDALRDAVPQAIVGLARLSPVSRPCLVPLGVDMARED